jgi:hypothetical protein
MGMSKKQRRKKQQLSPRAFGTGILTISIPKELRVSPVVDASELRTIKEKVANREKQIDELSKRQKSAEVVPSSVVRVLTHIATNAWRARIKMVNPDTGEPREDVKRLYRHIEAILDALQQIDIEIIDFIGKAYDTGMALKVISFEQTAGLSKEEIKETLRPSVLWQGQLIQMGEVIVGTPETASFHKGETA